MMNKLNAPETAEEQRKREHKNSVNNGEVLRQKVVAPLSLLCAEIVAAAMASSTIEQLELEGVVLGVIGLTAWATLKCLDKVVTNQEVQKQLRPVVSIERPNLAV